MPDIEYSLARSAKTLIYNNSNELMFRLYVPLPQYTMRLLFRDNITPTVTKGKLTQITVSPNVWDYYYANSDWTNSLKGQIDLLQVIEANTTGVVHMRGLFEGCTSLNKVCLFDTSSVTNMRNMFADTMAALPGVTHFSTLPLFDTSNVTTMQAMFLNSPIVTVPAFDTSKVTNMYATFDGCIYLESVPLLDTSKVTTMYSLFQSCEYLENVPLFDTSNVTNMQGMFAACTRLKTVNLFNTSKVTNMSYMFENCVNVETGAYDLYYQASRQTTPPTSHVETFRNCGSNTQTGAADLARIASGWK